MYNPIEEMKKEKVLEDLNKIQNPQNRAERRKIEKALRKAKNIEERKALRLWAFQAE